MLDVNRRVTHGKIYVARGCTALGLTNAVDAYDPRGGVVEARLPPTCRRHGRPCTRPAATATEFAAGFALASPDLSVDIEQLFVGSDSATIVYTANETANFTCQLGAEINSKVAHRASGDGADPPTTTRCGGQVIGLGAWGGSFARDQDRQLERVAGGCGFRSVSKL